MRKEKGSSFTHLGNGEGYSGCPENQFIKAVGLLT